MKKTITLLLIILSLNVSAQTGITWNMGMNLPAAGNEHPRIAVNGSGNPMVIWHHSARAMFSRWNGTAFTTPVMLNPMTMTIAGAGWMGPDIASHGDTVYVVFKQSPEASDTCHIYCVTSFDGGITFSAPVQVDDIGQDISRFPTVTTDDLGNPIIGFMRFDMTFGNARWVVTRSTDFGNYFFPDVLASGWSSMTSTVCDCCPGSIACAGNNVAMLYRDNNSNIRDSWAGLSTDGGTTFTSGMNIDQQNWMIMMCVSSGPDGVIIGDSLYAVCMNGASGQYSNFFSASSVSAATGSPGIPLTGAISGLTVQNYPRIANAGSAVAVVWKQVVSGGDQCVLRFTNNITTGLSATYDTVDLDNITNADVALTNGNIYVVWQDDGSGTIKYRSGTFTPINTSVNEIPKSIFSVYPNPITNELNISGLKFNDEIKIADVLGKEIYQNKIITPTSNFKLQTSNFDNGCYFITIQSEKITSTQKIILNK